MTLATGWTPPITYASGDVPTHTQFNTHIRDNMNVLGRSTALGAFVRTHTADLWLDIGRSRAFVMPITTHGNPVILSFYGQPKSDADVDYKTGQGSYVRIPSNRYGRNGVCFAVRKIITGLTSGENEITVRLRYDRRYANIWGDNIRMSVREFPGVLL